MSRSNQSQKSHLLLALELAETRRGRTSPNPAVGAVVVKHDRIIGEGSHLGAGHPHAEVEALKALGDEARGATVFVTLEPCCHTAKRTPPCTELLIEKQVGEVIYGYRDPNPQVAGQGEKRLLAAGIPCRQLATDEVTAFYESYTHWTINRRPFVTAKIALSLDGRIAGANGKPVAITGEEARRETHRGRRRADAILTTARTILADDPQLNVREGETALSRPLYVLDRDAELPLTAKVFTTAQSLTVFHDPNAPAERLKALESRNVSLVPLYWTATGAPLDAVLERIGEAGRHDLWVEAGGKLFASLVSEGRMGRALLYVGPRWQGEQAIPAFGAEGVGLFETARVVGWRSAGRDAIAELRWS
jgi:diaminohydroxyphosphoribosylaminopyrimidine deaminase/5-amino-6-(5-phosphoribosylamino)uracil reductase